MSADRPIFVLGCPRSGTTLLQLMLHSHHRIAVPPETRFLQAAYRRRNTYGDLRVAENRRALATWITSRRHTLFYDLGLDGRQLVEEITAGPPTLGSVIGAVFRAYARRHGKPRWGDKRPGYYQSIPALLRLFPDAQIIHLIRDGRDCAASLMRMPWFTQDVSAAICTWLEAISCGQRAKRSLPAGAYLELRYERLAADPERELARLCVFLSEDYDPAMAEPHKIAAAIIPARKTWHADTHREVTARTGTWRSRLAAEDLALCEAVMGRRLLEHGYELSGQGRPPAARIAQFATVAARRRGAAWKWGAIELMERMRENGPVHSLL